MKKFKCNICGIIKNETEFYYDYFKKKYLKNKCKKCDNYNGYNFDSDAVIDTLKNYIDVNISLNDVLKNE